MSASSSSTADDTARFARDMERRNVANDVAHLVSEVNGIAARGTLSEHHLQGAGLIIESLRRRLVRIEAMEEIHPAIRK